jgi:hypothetical protein
VSHGFGKPTLQDRSPPTARQLKKKLKKYKNKNIPRPLSNLQIWSLPVERWPRDLSPWRMMIGPDSKNCKCTVA